MSWRRVLGLVALVAASACGVSTQSHVSTVEPSGVPFGLAAATDDTSPTTAIADARTVAEIYLVDGDGRLLAVLRTLDVVDPTSVVAALLEGPTQDEADFGLLTALPDGDIVRSVDVVDGVAAVDLGDEFATADGATQRTALAQIVYTLTGRPGIGRVSFTLEGQPVEIPRGDGSLTTGSVSRDSYREMQPVA